MDSNIIIRFVTQDEPEPYQQAMELIQASKPQSLYVSIPVVVECYWVLERLYKLGKPQLIQFLEMLISSRQFYIQHKGSIIKAIKRFEQGRAQFVVALITSLCLDDGCDEVLSFDKNARTVGMTVL